LNRLNLPNNIFRTCY